MQLSPETWPAVSALLDEALALPVEERDTWLQSLDGERAALKDTLRELLSRAEGVETGDFLATLPRFTEVTAHGPLTELAAGDSIGPYRLISELGTGGMGAVWLAERSDGQLKRKVALKLPRMVWARGLAERMARERDILATLEHPNIARLYDAGVDQHGRPYLALEYVEGQPIDLYAKERGLGVKDKLQLLLQVCSAVAFAHSRLVVHRDLKPSNILVTQDGQVRLLDFGIAKLMEGDSAKETQLTQLAGRALTLDYASPEQIKGEPIGTASDVYSLGVVAYELLTGAKPYRLKRGSAAELEEAIATADPLHASDAAADKQIQVRLRGDIDAILNKTLRKEPSARYGTVNELREDLERHLRHEPVKAQPDAISYRLAKFLRRYRLQAFVTSVFILGIVVAAASAFWQASVAQARREEAVEASVQARAAQQRAEQVKQFIVSLISEADPLRSQTPNARVQDLLLTAQQRVKSELEAQPEIAVELLTLIGGGLANLAEFSSAAIALDDAYRLVQGPSADPLSRARVQRQFGELYGLTGKVDDGLRAVDDALSQISGSSASDATNLKLELASLKSALLANKGSLKEALQVSEQAATLSETTPAVPALLRLRALSDLSHQYLLQDRFAEAAEVSGKALALASADDRVPQVRVADAVNTHVTALSAMGRFVEAEAQARTNIERLERQLGKEHWFTADAWGSYAEVLMRIGDTPEALKAQARSVELRQRRGGNLQTFDEGVRRRNLGILRLNVGDPLGALRDFAVAIPLIEREVGPQDFATLSTRALRARALGEAGRLEEAYRELVDIERQQKANGQLLWPVHVHLANIERRRGRLIEASRWADRSTGYSSGGLSKDLPVFPLLEWARVRLANKDLEARVAIERLEETVKSRPRPGPDHAHIVVLRGQLAALVGDVSSAQAMFEQAETYWQRVAPRSIYLEETRRIRSAATAARSHQTSADR